MKVIEKIVNNLEGYLKGKKVLEIACGDSDFSLTASNLALEVLATDISLERFKKRKLDNLPANFNIRKMGATSLTIDNNSFDVCACFNALGHLKDNLSQVLSEMCRVTKENGYLIFIVTWKMEMPFLNEINNNIVDNCSLTSIDLIKNNNYSVLILRKNKK